MTDEQGSLFALPEAGPGSDIPPNLDAINRAFRGAWERLEEVPWHLRDLWQRAVAKGRLRGSEGQETMVAILRAEEKDFWEAIKGRPVPLRQAPPFGQN